MKKRMVWPAFALLLILLRSHTALAQVVSEFTLSEDGLGYDRMTISATGPMIPLLMHSLPETRFVTHDIWHVRETVTNSHRQLNKHLYTDAILGPEVTHTAYQVYRSVFLDFVDEKPRMIQATYFGKAEGFFETLYYYLEPYFDDQLSLLTRNRLTSAHYRPSDLTFVRVLSMPGDILASNGYLRTDNSNRIVYSVGLDQAAYGDVLYAYSKTIHAENRLLFRRRLRHVGRDVFGLHL